ncbi:MAG TPA: pitrilysin family protein [Hyphomicrobiaceae bacterium]|nr:pitrilysin family protein [Hyphomicrobiaceae bacterium]
MRVVTERMPRVETVALGVWVAAGSRHERPGEHGISHLLEHMAFKGTTRRSARAIAEEIEQVGGDLNAATSIEMTSYYARILKGDVRLALDILADILLDPRLDPGELAREQEVILQEIAGARDSPDDVAYDLAQEAAFAGQALGRPILGTPKSVSGTTAEDLRAFLKRWYTPERMVIGAAGQVDHAAVVRHAEALFGGLDRKSSTKRSKARWVGGKRASPRSFEQSHLIVGFEGPSYRDRDFFAAQVLSALLGGGMSSRLFQEVRERRGLAYSIYSTCWGLDDTGMLSVHAATGPSSMSELIDVVGEEMQKVASERAPPSEVQRAKAQLKAGLLMSLESPGARAEQIARQIIVHDRVIETEELVDRVDAVTPNGVRSAAERLLAKGEPSIALVGVGRRGRSLGARVAEKLGAVMA